MKFELTLDEVNIVMQGLGELPAKTSFGLIQKFQQNAQAQMAAQEENDGTAE